MSGRYRISVATTAAATVLTAVLVFTPLRFTYRSAELRVSLETAQAVIAALVALLLYGRYRRTGRLGDLLSTYALALFCATSLFFALLPALADPNPGGNLDRFDTWAPLLARGIGAAALAWAAVGPRRWFRLRNDAVALALALGATLGVIAAVVTATLDWLPPVLELADSGSIQRPSLDAPPAILAAQLGLVALYAAAAVGFARQSEREPNPLATALASGTVLAAFARLNFFLYPSIYTDVVHVGDVLRLLWYLVLLVGAAAEITGFWRLEAEAVAARERQRIAQELHDGLAQELAFIRSHTAAMARGTSPPGVTPLVVEAAERAMAESRRVVEALRADAVDSVERLLGQAVGDVARWAGTGFEVSVDPLVSLPAEAHAPVGDLVRRAATAAVRSRAPSHLWVHLELSDGRAVLAVEDNGAAPPGPGDLNAGLREVTRRAEAFGAVARTVNAGNGRTRLEFVLPWRPPRPPRHWEGS
jgi:signal transduction histidine kinase